MQPWFDTHCHLDFPPFSDNWPAHSASFTRANIKACLVPAVGPENWQAVLALKQPNIAIALGLHPCFLSEGQTALEQQLADLAQKITEQRKHVSALGECGLDKRFSATLALQAQTFETQIALAAKHHLPLIVHSVRMHAQVVAFLKRAKFAHGGIIHAFSGSYEQARAFVDLGFKLGVGGVITWPNAEKTRKALARLPLEALVLETDAPDMPLHNMRDAYNSPLNLPLIFDALSQIRHEEREQLKAALWRNACDVLAFDEMKVT